MATLSELIAQSTGRSNTTALGTTAAPGAVSPLPASTVNTGGAIGDQSVDPMLAMQLGGNYGDELSKQLAVTQREEAMALRDGAMPGMRHTRGVSVAAHPLEFAVAGYKAHKGKKDAERATKAIEEANKRMGDRALELSLGIAGDPLANARGQMTMNPGQTKDQRMAAQILRK